MASNPMQRKARNSFLLGVLITTLILGCIIGFLIYQMYANKKEQEEIDNARKTVYVLKEDVSAGTNVGTMNNNNILVTPSLRLMEVESEVAPSTAVTVASYATTINDETLFKIDLKANTILTTEMLVQAEDATSDDTREQEYNMITLPTYLQADDYIDIRLRLPSGEDYIVVSKKKVKDTNETTIWIDLNEDEILTLSNAIVETYQIQGTELYATTYIEPALQGSSTVTYAPSISVTQLINSDPNVLQKAKDELAKRYSIETLYKGRTDIINKALQNGEEDATENVSTGVSTSIENRKQSRTQYLQELEGAATTTTEQ